MISALQSSRPSRQIASVPGGPWRGGALRAGRRPEFGTASFAALLLAAATIAAYWSGLTAPFILDDVPSIVENPTIRNWWPLPGPLSPPAAGGSTVEGRPVLNLTFALNHTLAGLNPAVFRATNVAIHIACGLLLFGLARRTLLRVPPENAPRRNGEPAAHRWLPGVAAALAAGLWLVHPLNTIAVTYIAQRAESLCALWFLLTLYSFERYAGGSGRGWAGLAMAACFLGMATKEVMVVAPVLVLLYDRAFVAGSLGAAWRERRGVYLALLGSWVLLGVLVAAANGRGGTAGFAAGISSWHYLLTQSTALLHYTSAFFWPAGLVFDHGTPLHTAFSDVAGSFAVCGLLIGWGLYLVWRRPRVGFPVAVALLWLAPTTFVPVATQTIAEHRMYLPTAALVLLSGVVLWSWLRHYTACLGVGLGALLMMTTMQRNALFNDPVQLWRDTVTKRPANTRAQNNLALQLLDRGRASEALTHLDAALAREPGSIVLHNNRAMILAALGRHAEALVEIDGVLAAVPALPEALDTKAQVLRGLGRHAEAQQLTAEAVRLNPRLARVSAEKTGSPFPPAQP